MILALINKKNNIFSKIIKKIQKTQKNI